MNSSTIINNIRLNNKENCVNNKGELINKKNEQTLPVKTNKEIQNVMS